MAMENVTIRTKSSGPLRRAGLLLAPLGQWVEHQISSNMLTGLTTVLALVCDPKVEVAMGLRGPDGTVVFNPAPTEADIRAALANIEDSDEVIQSAAVVETPVATAIPPAASEVAEVAASTGPATTESAVAPADAPAAVTAIPEGGAETPVTTVAPEAAAKPVTKHPANTKAQAAASAYVDKGSKA
jgi:hypothetical protein